MIKKEKAVKEEKKKPDDDDVLSPVVLHQRRQIQSHIKVSRCPGLNEQAYDNGKQHTATLHTKADQDKYRDPFEDLQGHRGMADFHGANFMIAS